MQHIKLTIPGEFWDTQLYSGSLYLFDDDCGIKIVDWEKIINDYFPANTELSVSAHVAFLESNLFYTKGAQILFKDTEIKKTLLKRFDNIAKMNLVLDLGSSNNKSVIEQRNPFPFPHADSEIYYSKMYVGLKSGVYCSPCASNQLKSDTEKIWDAPIFDITASRSYTTMAFATGSDGLFQLKVHPPQSKIETKETPKNISEDHCAYCDWSYFNIFATSYTSSSFFAAFKKSREKKKSGKTIRSFEKIFKGEDIFSDSSFSWGIHDKIYAFQNDATIKAIKYSSDSNSSHKFTPIGNLELDKSYGKIVSAKAAAFGTILEFDECIVVISSDKEILHIPGEPINWRIFPNSKNYTNQLHVIYDGRLEIYSFYKDYFVDQKSKISGINMLG